LTAFLLTGCIRYNLTTPPTEITGSYVSDLKYSGYNCQQLASEVNSLSRRENSLVIAQEQRHRNSQRQARITGYGTGDGIEAFELANVRGEKEAARLAMDKAGCR